MLFLTFDSQEERRKYGGSAFIEMQFCKLPPKTKTKNIVKSKNINNWQNDSLYINNEDAFYQEYSRIFNCDIFGINYYDPLSIDPIIEKLHEKKPIDYEALVAWLKKAKQYNGFYILGL